jgi:hypothetical protein
MNNQNVADISLFENLQAEQHDRTGMSQMGVFNSTHFDNYMKVADDYKKSTMLVISTRADYKKSLLKYNKANDTLRKLETDFAILSNNHKTICDKYDSALDFFGGLETQYNKLNDASDSIYKPLAYDQNNKLANNEYKKIKNKREEIENLLSKL